MRRREDLQAADLPKPSLISLSGDLRVDAAAIESRPEKVCGPQKIKGEEKKEQTEKAERRKRNKGS